MRTHSTPSCLRTALIVAFGLTAGTLNAAVIPITAGAFPASTPVTFNGLSEFTEVNGLTVGGITFTYSLGNGIVVIDGGPGVTNNISPQNIVSIGNNTGVLRLALPGFFDSFGYGFAILNTVSVANATTITLFSGMTSVGSLSYAGTPDPTFAGGFAGIQSTIPFNNVALTFNAVAAPAFALDNVRLAAIPEPSTIALTLSGLVAMLIRARRRSGKLHS